MTIGPKSRPVISAGADRTPETPRNNVAQLKTFVPARTASVSEPIAPAEQSGHPPQSETAARRPSLRNGNVDAEPTQFGRAVCPAHPSVASRRCHRRRYARRHETSEPSCEGDVRLGRVGRARQDDLGHHPAGGASCDALAGLRACHADRQRGPASGATAEKAIRQYGRPSTSTSASAC